MPLRADGPDLGVERAHDAAGPWRHRLDELYRAYNVARLFASIDHISQGRAAWNVVTNSRPRAALNFSFDRQMDHELRYQRAEEFVDVVKGLWDCWEDGALLDDTASGVYIDDSKIRPLKFRRLSSLGPAQRVAEGLLSL